MKSEFVPPVYANTGAVEPPTFPAVLTIERTAEILQISLEAVVGFISEGRLRQRVFPREIAKASTLTTYVEGEDVVALLSQKYAQPE